MLYCDEDEFKKMVFGVGIGVLAVMVLWFFEGAHADAFGTFWHAILLLAAGIGIIAFAVWWMIDW